MYPDKTSRDTDGSLALLGSLLQLLSSVAWLLGSISLCKTSCSTKYALVDATWYIHSVLVFIFRKLGYELYCSNILKTIHVFVSTFFDLTLYVDRIFSTSINAIFGQCRDVAVRTYQQMWQMHPAPGRKLSHGLHLFRDLSALLRPFLHRTLIIHDAAAYLDLIQLS